MKKYGRYICGILTITALLGGSIYGPAPVAWAAEDSGQTQLGQEPGDGSAAGDSREPGSGEADTGTQGAEGGGTSGEPQNPADGGTPAEDQNPAGDQAAAGEDGVQTPEDGQDSEEEIGRAHV